MGLSEYRRKRDFRKTAEPPGAEHPSGSALAFVVQKHAASHLHYDFRLELDGVLKSWAVPKGPSFDPSVKRLAVHVEDHPVEYGDFEGVIPKGEYGGGTVMVWDTGSWEPQEDPHKGYRKGHLKFRLHGQKLHGGWHLVRSRRPDDDGGKEQWLLFKADDADARPESDGIVTEDETASAKTGRSIEEIANDADATWHSNRPVSGAAKSPAPSSATKKPAARTAAATAVAPGEIAGARKAAMPSELLPEMTTPADEVPEGDGWLHEIKFDGYRLVVFLDGGQVRMLTRKANDWTARFQGLVDHFAALPVDRAIVDGEVVIVAGDGTTSFQQLQNVLSSGRQDALVFYAFDLLYLDGYDLRGVPLIERKAALKRVMEGTKGDRIRFSDHVEGHGDVFWTHACRIGLEGIVAKRADSHYVSRRTKDWLKVKCQRRQEFVIGGYTDPKGTRSGFGSLILGYYRDGELVHAGRAGTGFTEPILRSLHRRLKKLEIDTSPFVDYGRTRKPRDIHWVRPELVGEVAFAEWTDEGLLRHPTFQGLREDKPAAEVVREEAKSLPRTKTSEKEKDADPPAPSVSRRGSRETEVAGVRLTNPDKVIDPASGLTKLALARYYEEVGEDWMLPYAADRPLSLVRCPDGIGNPCFYQKHADERFHKAVKVVKVEETAGEDRLYTYVDSVAGLVAMVQMGVLELHVWGSHRDDVDKPDLFVLDLDPGPGVSWERVVASTLSVRDQLAELGLQSWCKTTGGKGLHVVVPISRRLGWDEVKEFTRLFCAGMARKAPGEYITVSTLAKRKGKIFLDYLRNGRGATAISAFSIRSRPNAPVSVPLTWDELTPKVRSDQFTTAAVIQRLKRLTRDPWEDFWKTRQSITRAMRDAVGMKS
jgi:bifunctional non-homologous end joining protein LigD